MSLAWETTPEDVDIVLHAHGITLSEERLNEITELLDHDKIEDNLLHYTDILEQIDSMLNDIEDALMANNIIPQTEKKFASN